MPRPILFYEADLRKKGYHFKGNDWNFSRVLAPIFPQDVFYCNLDTSILSSKDMLAFFTWGVQEYYDRSYDNALRILKKVVALDKTNPLVFHYLGKIYYDQQKWEEAEIMFKLAINYSKSKINFDNYLDSVIQSHIFPYDHSCFEQFFRGKYYDQVEDYYFIGTVYEEWAHLEEAEMYFRQIIRSDMQQSCGYVKLWQLLEKQGRYNETEDVIKTYRKVNNESADCELNEFYRRTIEKFPEDGDLHYRLGTLLYNRASANARTPYLDSIVRFPLLNKELLIDIDIYNKLNNVDSLALSDKSETGGLSRIKLNHGRLYEPERFYLVPGTSERIKYADAIYLPRKDGIMYLKKAAELISEKEALADIHFKIGNIYLWAGSKKQAYPYFEKSLALIPGNANARLTLIDIYKALYKNRAALKQLNYLYDSSQINFEKRMLMAKFTVHAGQFTTANSLLNKAEMIYPYTVPEITDLRGRLNLLYGKPKEAITFYKAYLRTDMDWIDIYSTEDSTTADGDRIVTYVFGDRRRFTAYTLSRLYAGTENKSEAFKWLETAIEYGFNYSFVLQNDPLMEELRKTAKWRTLVNSITAKQYGKVNPTERHHNMNGDN